MTSLQFGPVVLGGNVFGWTVPPKETDALLDAFVDAGGRSVDTADVYVEWLPGRSGGESESQIGAWLGRPGNRDRVDVHTKVFSKSDRRGLSPDNIVLALEDSLRRLQTDHVDLYYAHRDDPDVPQEDYVVAFDALVRSGKVREVGASNFTSDRLRSALKLARDEGLAGFTVAQDQWSLVERDLETSLVPTLVEQGIVELPYAALASGFLSGKYRPGQAVDSARSERAGSYLERPGAAELLTALDEIAAAHDAPVSAVALAWLRAQPVVGAPIASARTPEQLAEIMTVVELSPDEVARLGGASAPVAAAG